MPIILVTIAEAQQFIKGIVGDEGLWPVLLQNPQWGGHWHRVFLELAVSDQPPETEVNIIPPYIDRRVQEPSYQAVRSGQTDPQQLRAQAIAEVLGNRLNLQIGSPNRLPLLKLVTSFGYGGSMQ